MPNFDLWWAQEWMFFWSGVVILVGGVPCPILMFGGRSLLSDLLFYLVCKEGSLGRGVM